LVLAVAFMLALVRTAAHADETSERLQSEHQREQAQGLPALTGLAIEARRVPAGETAALSRRRTWRQPSSA
jgi:hypothetical protein